MADRLLFESSREVRRRLTEVFEFVWPTAAAMWNLRWQVKGYMDAVPTASQEELSGRFVAGSHIHGADLRRACITISWKEQLSEFARFLLVDLCALYEAWCDGVVAELKMSPAHRKNMQFPSILSAGGNPTGVGATLQEVSHSKSVVLERTIYPSLKKNRKYSQPQLDNLLKCYRYFKECRNAIVHHGSRASKTTENAFLEFSRLTKSDLVASEVPKHYPVKVEAPIELDLRGVVGFSDIILKLIITLDAELSVHRNAEAVLAHRWKQAFGTGKVFPADMSEKSMRVARHVKKLGLGPPRCPKDLIPILRKYHLIKFG